MIDDETSGMAKAVRTEPGTIPIARGHQKVSSAANLDHFTFGAPAPVEELDSTATQTCRARRKKRRRLFCHSLSDVLSRVTMMPVERAPEQPGRGRLGRITRFCGGNVEQGNGGAGQAGEQVGRPLYATGPGAFDQPDHDPHAVHLRARENGRAVLRHCASFQPNIRIDSQRATVELVRTRGTLKAPRLTNSLMAGCSPSR
jgi:hypothetical protein